MSVRPAFFSTRRGSVSAVVGLFSALPILASLGCGERGAGPDSDPALSAPAPSHSAADWIPHPLPDDDPDFVDPFSLDRVEGQLIVELASDWTAAQVSARWGTKTVAVIEGTRFALIDYSGVRSGDGIMEDLEQQGACISCEPNFYLETPEAEQGSIPFYESTFLGADVQNQQALARIRSEQALHYARGFGIVVAVLDTGIDFEHPDLTPRVAPNGWDFVDDDALPQEELLGVDRDGDGLVDEAAGHGTHVSGIILSVAPHATILPVRVLDSEGRGTLFHLAAGIRYAADRGAQVINLSLGLDGVSYAVKCAVRHAYSLGSFLVGSAGNDGRLTFRHFPASLPEVVAVAATSRGDGRALFSNYGRYIDIAAPGEQILSTYLDLGYAIWSGTSMAAPFVSGAAALVLEAEPTLAPHLLLARIQNAAVPVVDPNGLLENRMGAGRIDLLPLVLPAGLAPDPRP